jgi:large subunit ribosomal protein L3
MKTLTVKKVNMTQIFDETGAVQPVTVLVAPEAVTADDLVEGDIVAVTATSKGKGFQGVVKRHGFKGGRRSHGQKHSEREPGSIGGGGRAGGRVMAGMRMAGRMGGETVTVKNLRVLKILPETNEIFIRGAVPGRRGTVVKIKSK